MKSLVAIFLLGCVIWGAGTQTSAAAEKITGIARVVSSDTLQIGRSVIRLRGIRAISEDKMCGKAQQNWPCGWIAINALVNFVGRHWITCSAVQGDNAECFAGPVSINRWMVDQGWATADVSAGAAYRENEITARRAGRGMWGDAPPTTLRLPRTP